MDQNRVNVSHIGTWKHGPNSAAPAAPLPRLEPFQLGSAGLRLLHRGVLADRGVMCASCQVGTNLFCGVKEIPPGNWNFYSKCGADSFKHIYKPKWCPLRKVGKRDAFWASDSIEYSALGHG